MVWAFGDGDYGKLGIGNTAAETKPVLVSKLNDVGIKKIAAGTHFSVALSKTGVVYTWGQGKATVYYCVGRWYQTMTTLI